MTRNLDVGGQFVKLQCWDTSGQERYRAISTSYYRGADIVFVCCDLTNRRSFDNIPAWLREVEHQRAIADCTVFIIGCKSDADKRVVTPKMLSDLAGEHGVSFAECSARTNDGVFELFATATAAFLNNKRQNVVTSAKDVRSTQQAKKQATDLVEDTMDELCEAFTDSDLNVALVDQLVSLIDSMVRFFCKRILFRSERCTCAIVFEAERRQTPEDRHERARTATVEAHRTRAINHWRSVRL